MFLGKLVNSFYLFKIAYDLDIYLSSAVDSGIDYLYDLVKFFPTLLSFLVYMKWVFFYFTQLLWEVNEITLLTSQEMMGPQYMTELFLNSGR